MSTPRARKLRITVEAALTTISAAALVLTLVARDWIEQLTGASPDGGSGETEWLFTAAAVVATAVFGSVTAWEWRRVRAARA